MDWLKIRTAITEYFAKYKFVLLIIVLGIILMLIPTEEKQEKIPVLPSITGTEADMEEKLENILGQIRGVGKVDVMITEQTGAETIYQADEDSAEGETNRSVKRKTVIVSGNGTQSGLVQTVTPPTYLGAIIVCQGGGSQSVKLAVANAVSAATGITLDRISVLEMK